MKRDYVNDGKPFEPRIYVEDIQSLAEAEENAVKSGAGSLALVKAQAEWLRRILEQSGARSPERWEARIVGKLTLELLAYAYGGDAGDGIEEARPLEKPA